MEQQSLEALSEEDLTLDATFPVTHPWSRRFARERMCDREAATFRQQHVSGTRRLVGSRPKRYEERSSEGAVIRRKTDADALQRGGRTIIMQRRGFARLSRTSRVSSV